MSILTHIDMPPVFNLDVDASYFDNYFRCSALVHLCGSKSKTTKVRGNPRKDVYSYLGPKICPTSVSDLTKFWYLVELLEYLPLYE